MTNKLRPKTRKNCRHV